MLADTIRSLYDYNDWATQRIFDTAARVPPTQLDALVIAGHASIRQTLTHMYNALHGWVCWWDGSLGVHEAMRLHDDPTAYPDLADLRAAWGAVAAQTRAFLSNLSDADVQRVYSAEASDGSRWEMDLWRMLLQVVNHGTQHRSEVAAMLTVLGCSPGDLDLLYFYEHA